MDEFQREQLHGALSNLRNQPYITWNTQFLWKIDGVIDAPTWLRTIGAILPQDATLYFEGTDIRFEAAALYEKYRAAQVGKISPDTLIPCPSVFHVRFANGLLEGLATMAAMTPTEHMFLHIKAYQSDKLLMWFHDAFDGSPMFLSGCLSEESVDHFAQVLGKAHLREQVPDPQKSRERTEGFLKFLETQAKHPQKKEPWWNRISRLWR